jgi:hypothetical protein
MSIVQANPIYVCDLCGQRDLVYHHTHVANPEKTWGVGLQVRTDSTFRLMSDNISSTQKHICAHCISSLGRIHATLQERGYFD